MRPKQSLARSQRVERNFKRQFEYVTEYMKKRQRQKLLNLNLIMIKLKKDRAFADSSVMVWSSASRSPSTRELARARTPRPDARADTMVLVRERVLPTPVCPRRCSGSAAWESWDACWRSTVMPRRSTSTCKLLCIFKILCYTFFSIQGQYKKKWMTSNLLIYLCISFFQVPWALLKVQG